jgi:hypothetical protein
MNMIGGECCFPLFTAEDAEEGRISKAVKIG